MDTAQTEPPILDGVPADDAKYDAAAGLVIKVPRLRYKDFNWRGTLIGPKAVLTAKHAERRREVRGFEHVARS